MSRQGDGVHGLGSFIATTRKERGLLARELAERAGVPASWVRSLENGRINTLPSPERVRALAAALDVPVSALLIAAGYLEPDP